MWGRHPNIRRSELQIYKKTEKPPRPYPGEDVGDYLDRLRKAGVRAPAKRMIKTDEQIEGCIEAGRINSLVLDAAARAVREGGSTADIDRAVVRETQRLGGRAACLGFEGFPRSVCTSPNDVVCHGIPSESVILKEGDILNVDCTTVYNGYFGDASRMFRIGKVSRVADELIGVTEECVKIATKNIVPYESHLGDIGYYINQHARSHGFTVVREIGGHGVGLDMHEDPFVCHRGILGSGMLLVPGMIFTVEPMINEGSGGFYIDEDDGWTVYTEDGGLSAQIEYELLITEEGARVISK